MLGARLRDFPILLGCLTALGAASGCNWYPEPEWVFRPPSPVRDVRAKVAGVFLDAATLQPLSSEVVVHARNPNGEVVPGLVNLAGQPANSFVVTDGVLTFGVTEAAPLPLDLTLVVHADGYLSSSAQVRILEAGLSTFSSRLISLTNPPAGVRLVKQPAGVAGDDGRLQAETTLSTGDDGTEAASVTVTLPAETVMVGEDGRPLRGALTATLVAVGSTAADALLAFPGGFEASAPASPGSTRQPGVFQTLGFGTIDIRDADGRSPVYFTRPIVFRQWLDATAAAHAGDGVPVFTRDIWKGSWANDGTSVVDVDPAGRVSVVGVARRLSWWNFGRFAPQPELCASPPRVTVTGNPNALSLSVEVAGPVGYRARQSVDTESFDLRPSPLLAPLQLLARFGGKAVGAVEIQNPCDTEITLPVSEVADVQAAELTVDTRRVCAQDGTQFVGVPGVVVLVGPGGHALFGHSDASGRAIVRGIGSGESYRLVVHGFDGARHGPVQWTASEASATRTFETTETCVPLSGAAGHSGS